jgi:hypothetical protein
MNAVEDDMFVVVTMVEMMLAMMNDGYAHVDATTRVADSGYIVVLIRSE